MSWISCTTALLRLGRSGHKACHALMVETRPGSGGPGCRPGWSRVRAVCQWWRQLVVGGIVKASLGHGPGPKVGATAVVMASNVWMALWYGGRWTSILIMGGARSWPLGGAGIAQ